MSKVTLILKNKKYCFTLRVRPIRPGERSTWDHLMAEHHYLGFNSLVGESIRYVAELEDHWVALLGWSAACHPTPNLSETQV